VVEHRSPTPQLRGDSLEKHMHIMYVLKSKKDGKLYIGSTGNLGRRLHEHSLGLVKSTQYRRPLALVYQESFENKSDAQVRERYFKGGGKARNVLDELIMGA